MASVKVAVRSRPLNKRELEADSKLILRMDDNTAVLNNPKHQRMSTSNGLCDSPDLSGEKHFSFDHCYWSTDHTSPFAHQSMLYKDLGSEVVTNALSGYNACVFAYGQTGAGKTYTMTGSDDQPGLIPRICEALFTNLNEETVMSYRLEASYMEIYNEQVRDLLKLKGSSKTLDVDNAFLRIREHPKEGPFVQDLSVHPVSNYKAIESLVERGNSLRVTASTLMNDTSSRSHAILKIKLMQAKMKDGIPSETISHINLVDLAGSERASASGAVGIRLKEGGNINKSLVTLGLVISVLAEKSHSDKKRDSGVKKQIFVPYRDSLLTWLLKDSIGGNSKTIMIATISPADVNYAETLSTLRYASRARRIVNRPVINEDPNVKIIRELRAEINRLKGQMGSRSHANETATKELEKTIAAKLIKSQQMADELTRTWVEKWKETQEIFEERCLTLRRCGSQTLLTSQKPHLVCLDGDPLSTDVILYHLEEGKTMMGSGELTEEQAIALEGSGVEEEHCYTMVSDHQVSLKALAHLCYVNNNLVGVGRTINLKQGDIVQFGHYLRFRFNNPGEAAVLRKQRRSGHYSSMPNLNRSSDSGMGSPEELERAESMEYLRVATISPERYSSASLTPSELSCIPDEEDDFHWKQEQLAKENKELSERREALRELMQQYRDSELARIKTEAAHLKEVEKEAQVFEMQKLNIERERGELMKQLKSAHHSLNVLKTKRANDQQKKRRLVEQEIEKLIAVKTRGGFRNHDLERDVRKRKFLLKSKIEEYWKKLDLCESMVVQNELQEKQRSCSASRPRRCSLLHNGEDDEGGQGTVANRCDDEKIELIGKLQDEEKQLKCSLEEKTSEWDTKVGNLDKVLEEKKTYQVSVLDDCERVVHGIDKRMATLDVSHRKECTEIRQAVKDAKRMDIALEGVADIHEARLKAAQENHRFALDKLKREREHTLEKTKLKWDQTEQEIQSTEQRQLALSGERSADIDELNQKITNKEEEIKQQRNELPMMQLNGRTSSVCTDGDSSYATDKNHNTVALEKCQQDLLESKMAVKTLLSNVMQENLLELKKTTVGENPRMSSWSACLELVDSERELSIDNVVSCGAATGGQKPNIGELLERHVDVVTIEDKIASSHSLLRELADKQLQQHQSIVTTREQQREMLNAARLKEKEKIADNIKKLTSVTNTDHVARYLSLEEKKMAEFQKHLDELEQSMFSKMTEGKIIEEKLCAFNSLLDKDDGLASSLSQEGRLSVQEQTVAVLQNEKKRYDDELTVLREQIEKEREEYVETLNDQEEYEVIGNEYQEIRQLTFQVQSNVAISEVLQQVYLVSNMVEVKADHLKTIKHLQYGGWRYYCQKRGVTVFAKLEHGKLASFVGCGVIKTKPSTIFDAVRNPLSRFVYDRLLKHINVLEHISDSLKIIYMRHEARLCVLKQARDFCCLHVERIDGERFVVASQSVEHPDCIKTAGVHRAHVLPSGWVIEPLVSPFGDKWSLVWNLIRIDIGDDVSNAVTKYLSTRLPFSVAYLRDYLVMR